MKIQTTDIPSNPPTQMGTILAARKVIPVYQREYVWDGALRDNFIENILEAYEQDAPYFIGSMVFQNREDGTAEVVDGQQRLTTIFILLSVLVRVAQARNLSETDKDFLNEHAVKNLRRTIKTSGGAMRNMAMLQHADTTIDKAYIAISQNMDVEDRSALKMVQNLSLAYEELYKLLDKRFANRTVNQLTDLIDFINKKLLCIHHVAEDPDAALTIYARLNSSGKVLTKLHILKGMSFKEAEKDEGDWESLHEKWLTAERLIQKEIQFGGKLPERVAIPEETLLLYKLFLDFPELGEKTSGVENAWVGSANLGKVIFSDEAKSILQNNPGHFVESIASFTEEIQALRTGDKAPSASIRNYLKDIALVAQTQSQWLMVGIPLQRYFPDSEEAFRTLRNMVFVFSFALTGSGSASGIYKSLSEYLSPDEKGEPPSEHSLALCIQKMKTNIDDHWSRFVNAVSDLTYKTTSHHKLIRRILEFIEIELDRETHLGTVKNLGTLYRSKLVHIDHLQPTEVKQPGKKLGETYQDKIGNLALLEKTLNTALGDSPFDSDLKQNTLADSQYLATKLLTTTEDRLCAGSSKVLKQFFSQRQTMDEAGVDSRTEEILKFLELRLKC